MHRSSPPANPAPDKPDYHALIRTGSALYIEAELPPVGDRPAAAFGSVFGLGRRFRFNAAPHGIRPAGAAGHIGRLLELLFG